MSTSNDAGEHASPRMYFLQDEAASLAPGRQLPAPGAGSAVLLADDSSDMRELLKEILEDAGHRVQVASDGHEALERLRAGCFDVVVSDVRMPRLDGLGLTRAIRGEPALAHLPVVLVTSQVTPAHRERALAAGASAYLAKGSFGSADLDRVVRRVA